MEREQQIQALMNAFNLFQGISFSGKDVEAAAQVKHAIGHVHDALKKEVDAAKVTENSET